MLQKQDSNPIKKVIYPLPQKNRNDAIQSKRKRVIICKNTHPHFHCLKWNSDYRKKAKSKKQKQKQKQTQKQKKQKVYILNLCEKKHVSKE